MTALLLRWRLLPPPLVLRWRGPSGLPASLPAATAEPLAAIVGPPGRDGNARIITAVCDDAVPKGTPLAISRANAHLVKADATSKPRAFVVGLASQDTQIGFTADAATQEMTLSDWTAVTGSTALSPGQTYFLAAGGGLALSPVSSPDCLTVVGIAASATTLLIDPQAPLQL